MFRACRDHSRLPLCKEGTEEGVLGGREEEQVCVVPQVQPEGRGMSKDGQLARLSYQTHLQGSSNVHV